MVRFFRQGGCVEHHMPLRLERPIIHHVSNQLSIRNPGKRVKSLPAAASGRAPEYKYQAFIGTATAVPASDVMPVRRGNAGQLAQLGSNKREARLL